MAEFIQAFRATIAHEGGYVNDPDDPGGETYKGIARKMHSKWAGWATIDLLKRQPGFPHTLEKETELREQIGTFYLDMFWNRIQADELDHQQVANSIFDFAVNAGVATSVALAQLIVGAKADGIAGPETLRKINLFNPDHFLASFTIAKIARYVHIVKKRPTSRKYFYGWVCRAIEG